MAILVNLPDGSQASFPDGTPPETMKAAIQKRFPPNTPPAGAAPGSREYADWAAAQARAGKTLPAVGPQPDNGHGLLDQIAAGTSAAANAVPIAGPTLLRGLEGMRGAVQGMTPQQVHDETVGNEQANPVAAGVGTVAGTVLPFMGAGAIPGVGRVLGMTGNLGSRMGFGAASGAAIGATDTAARGGSAEDAKNSALLGGGIGAAFPLVGAGLRRLVSPLPMSASQRAAAQTMEREGVTLTAGQRTGSKKLKYLESELGGGAADAVQEQQARQFTRAAWRRAGVDADNVEPQTVDQALTTIGGEFDRLAANNVLVPDNRLGRDLGNVAREYNSLVPESQRAPIVRDVLNDIVTAVQNNGGQITGESYQALRSRLDKAARAVMARDPHLSQALSDIRTTLDAGMERSIAANNPADLGAWRQVRRNYRNMLVIEKAATGAGEQAAGGVITPARLRSAAIAQNRRAFARGRNDFTDLANAAVKTMTPLPQSGTAPRLAARLPLPLGAATGAGIGGTIGGIPGAVVGGVLGAGVPFAAGRAVLSAPGRAILSNQMMAGPAGRALIAPAVPGMLAEQKREPIRITVGR